MKNSFYLSILAFLVSLLMLSCTNDNDILTSDELDAELERVLVEASNGAGRSFFRLPDGSDLSQIPQDPRNPLTAEKIKLGQFLYHETGIGLNPRDDQGTTTFSCASCHHAQGGFQAGRKQGIGEGGSGFGLRGEGRSQSLNYRVESMDFQPIRSPTALNSAYQEVMLWNGQFGATGINAGTEGGWTAGTPKEDNHLGFEGLEIQAIAGQDVHRMDCNPVFVQNSVYKEYFDDAFPNDPVPDRYSKVNAGLAIAAYERSLLANEAPFQDWLGGETEALSDWEKRGAILFFGDARCAECHTGPALNSMQFNALGMNDLEGPSVFIKDQAEAEVAARGRGGFTGNAADMFAFKVPQLYSLRYSPFYGHGGNFTSIRDVIIYKNEAVAQNPNVPVSNLHPSFVPLGLSQEEISQLTAFIKSGLDDANLERYLPNALPSGNCFPNNDLQSRIDLGCQ